MAGTGTPV
jgi:hypothetical protein